MRTPRLASPSSPVTRLAGGTALGLMASAAAAQAEEFVTTLSSPVVFSIDSNYSLSSGGMFDPFAGRFAGTYLSIISGGPNNKPAVFHDGSVYNDGLSDFSKYNFVTDVNPDGTAGKPLMLKLGTETTINASSFVGPWPVGGGPPGAILSADWAGGSDVTQGFVGFSYKDADAAPTFYGWAELAFHQDTTTVALLGFAYEDTGADIITPGSLSTYALTSIPEPAATAIAAALLAGSAALYQRRRRATAA